MPGSLRNLNPGELVCSILGGKLPLGFIHTHDMSVLASTHLVVVTLNLNGGSDVKLLSNEFQQCVVFARQGQDCRMSAARKSLRCNAVRGQKKWNFFDLSLCS